MRQNQYINLIFKIQCRPESTINVRYIQLYPNTVKLYRSEKQENRIYSMDRRSRRSCREAAVGSVGIVVDEDEGSKAGPKILPIILDCFLLNFGCCGLFFPLTTKGVEDVDGWTFILTTECILQKKYIRNTVINTFYSNT